MNKHIGPVTLVKSGSDFHDLTEVRVKWEAGKPRPTITFTRYATRAWVVRVCSGSPLSLSDVLRRTAGMDLAPDPQMEAIIQEHEAILGSKMDSVVATTAGECTEACVFASTHHVSLTTSGTLFAPSGTRCALCSDPQSGDQRGEPGG